MTTAILFPVNNKGGVGKTSVLTDLIAMLSRSYNTGVIDFDRQGSLAGTLLDDQSIGSQPLESYDNFQTRKVTLQERTSFNFADAMRKLTVDIEPSETKVSIFPVGMLYRNPNRRERLERIVKMDFGGVDIIGVDLPPLSDAAVVLDYSLKPLVETMKDVRLVPIVVTTPEKNTIEIGLSQFPEIYAYLQSLGVGKKKINPILLINKLRIDYGDEKFAQGFNYQDLDKLEKLGLIRKEWLSHQEMMRESNLGGGRGGIEGIIVGGLNREGIVYDVRWLPYFSHVADERFGSSADGRFSFYFGAKPALFHFPQLLKIVKDEGYIDGEESTVDERVFTEQMSKFLGYLSQRIGQEKRQFYSMQTIRKNVADVQSRLIESLQEGRRIVYERWEQEQWSDSYRTWDVNETKVKDWGAKFGRFGYEVPMEALPFKVLADALYNTRIEIATATGEQVESAVRDNILQHLEVGKKEYDYIERRGGVHNIRVKMFDKGEPRSWQIEVEIDCDNPMFRRMAEKFPPKYALDIFLRNLNNSLHGYRA
ncbi:MAG: ParA family protein [Nanoarchaeota archaeon]